MIGDQQQTLKSEFSRRIELVSSECERLMFRVDVVDSAESRVYASRFRGRMVRVAIPCPSLEYSEAT
jgi:hypothetical protein